MKIVEESLGIIISKEFKSSRHNKEYVLLITWVLQMHKNTLCMNVIPINEFMGFKGC